MRRLLVPVVLLVTALATAQEAPKPHLLVVNDDGIDAPGLTALVDALREDWRITVCAPAVQQSGVGHGITYRAPVLVEKRPADDGIPRYAIQALPATCTRIGVTALLTDDPPALVVSGINRGANTGRSTWVSGTLGGAREGALMGLPAVAFSADHPRGKEPDWDAAAAWTREVLKRLHAAGLPRPGGLVSVNIPHPASEAKGVMVTRVELAPAKKERYEERTGPRGERLFVSIYEPPEHGAPGTDVEAVAEGWIAVTPLTLDQTDFNGLWQLLPVRSGARPQLHPPAAEAEAAQAHR